MDKQYDVFISHSSLDKKLGYAICSYLEDRKIKCWIAPRDINRKAGKEYAESIIEGIKASEIMIVIFNKNANESTFLKKEVERASHYNLILLPFKTDDSIPVLSLELYLSAIQWLDASENNPEDNFDELYTNCAQLLGRSIGFKESFSHHKALPDNKTAPGNNSVTRGNDYPFNVEKGPVSAKTEKPFVVPAMDAALAKKTTTGLRIFLFCVLCVPPLFFLPIFFIGLNKTLQRTFFDSFAFGILLWMLFCITIGCWGTIKFIKRYYRRIKPMKKAVTTEASRYNNFTPFYLTKTDRKYVLLNCCWLAYAPLLLLVALLSSLSFKDGYINYLGFSGLAVFLIQYAVAAFSLFSKTSPSKYRAINYVISIAYLVFSIIAIR